MKRIYKYIVVIAAATISLMSCDLNREPESTLPDTQFWNTESDLIKACNRLYISLPGFSVDDRADDTFGATSDNISNGSRSVPGTDDAWTNPYEIIFAANNILEKGVNVSASEAIKKRYFGEARFFRAFAYYQLFTKFGDIPLILKTLGLDSPELYSGRTPREDVLTQIYSDLDSAAQWTPSRATLPAKDWGRIYKSAALGLKARVALYEGTRSKFHNYGTPQKHLQIALDAATAVMGEGHDLYPNYSNLFLFAGEGQANKESVFIKMYGITYENSVQGQTNARDMENGRYAPTRNLINYYLYQDGLPLGKSPLQIPETSYNALFQNRDPRLSMSIYQIGESAYKGAYTASTDPRRTAFACKKGYIQAEWDNNTKGVLDKAIIRYAEILLDYAEAKYELNGSISDADLDLTINKIRTRAGLTVKLTNDFVTANSLNMQEEIRRERTVELAMEGLRYDDIIRWEIAEKVLTTDILGAKYFKTDEWLGIDTAKVKLNLNKDFIVIVEPASSRRFDTKKDYLYPVPLNEINYSKKNVTQNPGWDY